MFQLKNFVSISASMLNHIRGTTKKITDLIPGSVARTLVEAPAIEIEELYLQYFNGLREAIPVATFKSFGFGQLPAAYARGYVSVSVEIAPTETFTVASGTEFTSTDGRSYYSTEVVTWLAGATSIRIHVIAAAAGLSYNIAAGSITASTAFAANYTISNSAITNGRDIELDAERESRFADYISSLSRGTLVACNVAIRDATILDSDGNIQEYVTRIGFTEIPGYVRYFIYSSAGLPSEALLTKAQLIIDGWEDGNTGVITPGYRAGGVRMDVDAMSERAVPLTVTVGMLSGYELTSSTEQEISDAYATLLSSIGGGEVLYIEDIDTALLSVTGVKSVLISATENITCAANEALVPGAVTVTEL